MDKNVIKTLIDRGMITVVGLVGQDGEILDKYTEMSVEDFINEGLVLQTGDQVRAVITELGAEDAPSTPEEPKEDVTPEEPKEDVTPEEPKEDVTPGTEDKEDVDTPDFDSMTVAELEAYAEEHGIDMTACPGTKKADKIEYLKLMA